MGSDDADEAPVAEFKSAAQHDAELKAEDEAFCQEFNGFLKEDCMEKRQKDRDAHKYWNAGQVRNELWKTEKALADLAGALGRWGWALGVWAPGPDLLVLIRRCCR